MEQALSIPAAALVLRGHASVQGDGGGGRSGGAHRGSRAPVVSVAALIWDTLFPAQGHGKKGREETPGTRGRSFSSSCFPRLLSHGKARAEAPA